VRDGGDQRQAQRSRSPLHAANEAVMTNPTDAPPSALARAMTWLAVALSVLLLVLGTYWYGFSMDVQHRFWGNIGDRLHGPMTFRFILQPTMAFFAALYDGIRDARFGHKSFFWSAVRDPSQHAGRLREGLTSTARIVLLGLSMDVIYQLRVFDQFYPVEALMMAILLAVIPYFIFRWIVEIVARRWFARKSAGSVS